LGRGRLATYTDALRARGQLVPSGDPCPWGCPGGAGFVRGNLELLGLTGARCVECGTVNVPPSVHPSCISCGADKFEIVELARQGAVFTFIVNHTMPAPFVAPLPLIVIDLDDGTRVQLQGMPEDAPRGHRRPGGARAAALRGRARRAGVRVQGQKGGVGMSWNRVAVVGAGLIKFGELFDQSYEQMAKGAFEAALANVDKGLNPSLIDFAVVATQRGTLWGQEGIAGNTVPSALG